MSNLPAIVAISVCSIGMLALVAFVTVEIIDTIQDMKHKKKEWAREQDRREWGHR